MLSGDILQLEDGNPIPRRHHVDSVVALVRPRSDGGFLVVGERRIGLSNGAELDSPIEWQAAMWDDPSVRMNEGGCAPDGSLYVGSMAYSQSFARATLYRVTPDLAASVEIAGVTVSNGIAWDPSGTLAYYADTPTNEIHVFDWSPAAGLSGGRRFVSVPSPDGLCVDADGGVWVASFGYGRVHRFDEAGNHDAEIELPVAQVTSVAFAGARLDQLVITTSRYGLGDTAETEAGALFATIPGVEGLATPPFAG
jgi:sugar lactone lactonase YvrE